MPYESTWETRGVFTRWWGHSTSGEFIAYLEAAQASPAFDDARHAIHDFTACERFSMRVADLETCAALDGAGARSNPNVRIAVVANRQDVIEAVECYRHTMLSPYPVRIFPTITEARRWAAR